MFIDVFIILIITKMTIISIGITMLVTTVLIRAATVQGLTLICNKAAAHWGFIDPFTCWYRWAPAPAACGFQLTARHLHHRKSSPASNHSPSRDPPPPPLASSRSTALMPMPPSLAADWA